MDTEAEGQSDKWVREPGKSVPATPSAHLVRLGESASYFRRRFSVPTVRACPLNSPAMACVGRVLARSPGKNSPDSSGHGNFHPRKKPSIGSFRSPGSSRCPRSPNSPRLFELAHLPLPKSSHSRPPILRHLNILAAEILST